MFFRAMSTLNMQIFVKFPVVWSTLYYTSLETYLQSKLLQSSIIGQWFQIISSLPLSRFSRLSCRNGARLQTFNMRYSMGVFIAFGALNTSALKTQNTQVNPFFCTASFVLLLSLRVFSTIQNICFSHNVNMQHSQWILIFNSLWHRVFSPLNHYLQIWLPLSSSQFCSFLLSLLSKHSLQVEVSS